MKKNFSWKFLSLENSMMRGNQLLKLRLNIMSSMLYVIWVPVFPLSPKTLCVLLGFRDFDNCSLNLHLADSTIKKPMGRINDVIIVTNRNYVPIDFIVLDMDCNPSCPIILGRPFLRTIGAIIDMKEGNIRFPISTKEREWNTFLERK